MADIDSRLAERTILSRLAGARTAANRICTIDVVGLGIDLPGDLTLGNIGVLLSARRIFCIEPPAFYSQTCAQLGIEMEDISDVFDTHHDREDALSAAVTRVVDAGLTQPGIAFAFGGHPTTAVLPLLFLRSQAQRLGLSLIVHSAVSSLDLMLSDLVLDPTEDGFQVIRGRDSSKLHSGLPAAILCPGYARTIHFADRLVETSVLAAQLSAVYGAESEFLLYSRQEGRMVLETLAPAEVALLANRPRMGDLLLVGPVHLLPAHVHSGACA